MTTGLEHGIAEDSARTWIEGGRREEVVPAALRPPAPGTVGPRERHRLLWERHALRRVRAREHLAGALDPERGLPVAATSTVVTYLRALLRRRAGLVLLVTLANALAAGAALAVPMLLGRLVDAVVGA